MSGEIASLTAILASVADLAVAFINERDRHKLAAIKSHLTNEIIQGQAQLSQVLSSVIAKDQLIQTLSERVRELEAKQSLKARYRLTKMGALGQLFAYELRPVAELVEGTDEPPHFVCQPCFEADKKSVLINNGSGYWSCPVCGVGSQIDPTDAVRTAAGRGFDGNF